MSNPRWTDDEMRETLDASAEKSRQITRLRNELHIAQVWSGRVIAGREQDITEITALRAENEKLRAALKHAAHELELLYFFAISNGIAKEGIPPHVQARAALTQENNNGSD